MGYSAVAEGLILLKKTKDTETAAEYIRSHVAENVDIYRERETDCLSFSGSSSEYSVGTYRELYRTISGRCLCGHIDFRGEDGRLWCHHYNTEKSEWEKYDGRIVYDGLDTEP